MPLYQRCSATEANNLTYILKFIATFKLKSAIRPPFVVYPMQITHIFLLSVLFFIPFTLSKS